MQKIFTLAQDFGGALAWLIPVVCYISGISAIISGIYGFLHRFSNSRSPMSVPGVPFLFIIIGSLLLNLDKVLNVGNKTFGFEGQVGFGSQEQQQFNADTIINSAHSGPFSVMMSIVHLLNYFEFSYGALIVYAGAMRIINSNKGIKITPTSSNIIVVIFGFFVMNVETILTTILKETNSI